MWFRAEIAKDGSIASIEQVSEAFKDSKRIFYVEADSKAQACERVVVLYKRQLQRRAAQTRARRGVNRAAGLCPCGKQREDNSLARCSACTRSIREGQKRFRARQRGESDALPKLSELEKAARAAELQRKRNAKIHQSESERRRDARAAGLTLPQVTRAQHELSVLYESLHAFDRGDRGWFRREIEQREDMLAPLGDKAQAAE